jgi:hypothetical protein
MHPILAIGLLIVVAGVFMDAIGVTQKTPEKPTEEKPTKPAKKESESVDD